MRLSELIAGLPVDRAPGSPAGDPEIAGVTHDSRRVAAGDLFAAWRGGSADGAVFTADAVAAGAAAALVATGSEAAAGEVGAPLMTAADPHALLAPLAARAYRQPDRELLLVGITGTNGKSTVAALVAACLDAAGRPAGLLGTLGYRFGDLDLGRGRTTPEASDFYRALRTMRDAGAEAAAMEVSSHALALGRVAGARFAAAVFLNLTRDHFDFHRDFEGYFAAKRKLFSMLRPGGRAAVNVGDPYGVRLAAELDDPVTFAVGDAAAGADAQVRAVETTLDLEGIRGRIATPRGELDFSSPLLGRYNLENLVAAAAAAETLELPHRAVAEAFAARGPLPGRMQRVELPGGGRPPLPVFIDYAHTPAALVAALGSLREVTERKLVVVFGCGGDRDPGKRPEMGRVAGELAELPIITSDNPRTEDPMAIIRAVEPGLVASGNRRYRVVPDRREAIHRAVAVADERDWAVLIAGKGNEPVQLVGDLRLPFYDYDEALAALQERYGQAVGG